MTEEQARQLQENVLGKNKVKTSVWAEELQKHKAILDGANDGMALVLPSKTSCIKASSGWLNRSRSYPDCEYELFDCRSAPKDYTLLDHLGFTLLNVAPMGAVRTTKASMAFNKAYKRYCEWKDKVRFVLGMQDDVFGIDIVAFLEVPKSRTVNGKSKAYTKQERLDMIGTLAKVKPDWDNIAKGVQDACMTEDSAVSVGFCSKWYCGDGEERMYVRFRKNN